MTGAEESRDVTGLTPEQLQAEVAKLAVASNKRGLRPNDDGSFDLWFGPAAPEGKETNWVETLPGKSWFVILRLYGPLEPWFDGSWKLNELEPV